MLTVGGQPAHCPTCDSPNVKPVGRGFDQPALEYLECECGACWRLDTFLTGQKPARKARLGDPEPSQQAAQLDFTGRRQQVYQALLALGNADAQQVADWVNRQGHKPIQRSVASKRLGELVADGIAAGDQTHTNADDRLTTIYRLTEQARRQAA